MASSTASTENSTDWIPILDPVRHTATEVQHPVRDPKTPSHRTDPLAASPYWGEEPIWDSQTSTHNPMMDELGRTWFTARIRPAENPDFCKKGSNHPSAKVFPLERATRHLSMYDPKSGKFTLIGTCFQTHHLIFAEDADHTLWTSSGGGGAGVVGWINRRVFEQTGDEARAQGWTPFIVDANGNGKRDEWVEPNQAVDPAKDKRVAVNFYAVAVNPEGRVGLGHLARALAELRRARGARSGPHATRRSRKSTSRRSRATARAAATSIATACTGCRCRAVTWEASTARSARDR